MEQTFRASVEHNTGVMLMENGVSKEIITLDPLYLESDATIPYLIRNTDLASTTTALSEDATYSGYHIITLAEVAAINNACCAYSDTPPPGQPIMPYASLYWYWKDPSEIPGGLSGMEWVKQTLGINFDGIKRISIDEVGNEVITISTGTNQFWISDSFPDPHNSSIRVWGAGPLGITTALMWGDGITSIMRGIILVKNRS